MTVAARLVDSDVEPTMAQQNEPTGDDLEPFPRRVMRTLSRALQATDIHVRKGSSNITPEQASQEGLSVELVDSLINLASGSEGLRRVELRFELSPVVPEGEQGTPPVLSFDVAALHVSPRFVTGLSR
jgi:hypothetical protein